MHASSPEEDQRGGPLERYKEEKGTSRERERGLNEGSCLDGIKERKKKKKKKAVNEEGRGIYPPIKIRFSLPLLTPVLPLPPTNRRIQYPIKEGE